MELGYAISSEEHRPLDLVRNAVRAEEAGFGFALVSDHFHPWIDRQGESPFVWSVLGGIAASTERLVVGTGVTCPILRIHPAIVAQAAATAAAMLPGRFFLGVGTGENLNEHVLGQRWPATYIRREMLEEAVAVMRLLWNGRLESHRGRHFTVENARIYTLPEEPIDVLVAAGGVEAAELAGRIGDGLIGTAPDEAIIDAFDGRRRCGQAALRPGDRLLGRERGGGSAHSARVVAKRGARGAARPGASASLALRGGGRDGHRGRRRKGHRLRA